MEKQRISKSEFQELRELAATKNPAVKLISLSDLHLDENSVATNTLQYQGVPIRVGDRFIRELANILNVNVKLQRGLQQDEEVGQEMLASLLNALRMFQSRRKNAPSVTIIGDLENGIFTNIVGGNFARISNEGLFDIAENLMEQHSGLELIECKIGEHSPDISLKLLAGKEHRLVDSDKEIFNFGLTMSNNSISTHIGDFAYRLVCTNGMMGLKSENNFKLKDVGTQGLLDMNTHLAEAAERHFMPLDFEENVNTARTIEASYAEVEQAFNYVKSKLNAQADQRDRFEMALAAKYFHGYFDTLDKLKRRGVAPKDLEKKQKQFIPSGMKMWELINNITFLGSNKTGFEFINQDDLQVYGGKLMSKDADLKYAEFLTLK